MAAQTLKLVKVGNSRGVRLPKAALEALHNAEQFLWSVEDGFLKLQPIDDTHPPRREDWPRLIAAQIEADKDDGDDFLDWDMTLDDGLDTL
jgi:antitoxin component of MazEF toxin-antitoxin module